MNHFRLGFSDADKWMTCGAYCRTVAGVGEESSPSIEFGNVSHKILEDRLNGITVVRSPANEEQYDCAAVAFDYVLDVLAARSSDVYAELTCELTSAGRDDIGGTGDIFMWNGKVLEYIDLKTGAGTYVSEGSSAQLKLNALAFCDRMSITPESVKLTIVQPLWWGDEDPIRSVEVSLEDLRDWMRVAVLPAIERNDDPESPGVVSEKCTQCRGRHVCVYRDQAIAKGITMENLSTTMDATMEMINKAQDVTVYDNDRLADTLRLIPVIQDYCKSLQEHAQEIIMRGEKVPGYKVVHTAGVPTWVGDMEELETKLRKSTIKEADYTKSTLRTPKQVAALKTGPNNDKPMSKAIAKVIADHTGRSAGGLALVEESDERESAAPAFTAQTPVEEIPLPDFLL